MYRGSVGPRTQLAPPPPFARLAGEPLRWRLLRELARSDRQVRELAALAGQPQNLVSYHLGQLRAPGWWPPGGAASMAATPTTTSSWTGSRSCSPRPGRRCIPGLQLARAAPAQPGAGPPGAVLFLCTGNSARSQIAEALAAARSAGRVEAFSAGSHPKPVHPHAVRVMAGRGIGLPAHRPKHLSMFAGQTVRLRDHVVRQGAGGVPGVPRPTRALRALEHPRPGRAGGETRPPIRVPRTRRRARYPYRLPARGPPCPAPGPVPGPA